MKITDLHVGEIGANRFLLLILSILIIIYETPYLSRNMSPTIVVSLMILFFLLFFLGGRVLRSEIAAIIGGGVVYIALELIYKFLEISSAGIGYYFATIKFVFLFIAMACIGPQLSARQKKFLCILSITGMIANMVSNVIIYSAMDPSLYVVYYLQEGQNTNAADTAFASAVMLLMGVFFLVMLNSSQKWMKFISIAGLFFSAYFLIFISQRGTTFFLAIMMILLLSIFGSSSRKQMYVFLVLSLVMLWFAMGGAVVFLSWLSDTMSSLRINFKVRYLIHFFESGNIAEAGGSLSDRYELMMKSVDTFGQSIRSMLLGVGDHRDSNLFIGNHSQIIDTFARYGLIGGACLVWFFNGMKNVIKATAAVDSTLVIYKQLMVLYAFFIIRGFLGNTFIGSIGTQLFVTAPFAVSLIANGKNGTYPIHHGIWVAIKQKAMTESNIDNVDKSFSKFMSDEYGESSSESQ